MTQSNGELLAPIPGDNPAGLYLRYEPLYDQVKEARREEDDLPQGDWTTARKVADWSQVIRLTTDALTKKSKDLQLAAWLTEGWLRRDGFPGLHRGLTLLHDLLQQYWDTVYPPVDDGDTDMRAAPLSWVGLKLDLPIRFAPLNQHGHSFEDFRMARTVPTREQAESDSSKREERERAVAEGRLTPEDVERAFDETSKEWFRALVEDMDGALGTLTALDEFCEEHFEEAPSFLVLRSALEEMRQTAGQLLARKLELEPDPVDLEQAPEPGEALAPAGAEEGAPASAPAAGAALTADLSAGPRSAEEAAAWIAAAARKLRQENPGDPSPYLMIRGLRWGELRAGGGTLDARLLGAPPTDVRTRLKGLLLDASWPELLNLSEEVMAQPHGRGWLDLQRYVLTALDGLGPAYATAAAAVRGAVRQLLADLPDLVSATLMDDSPTANGETRLWLREEGLLPSGADDPDAVLVPRSTPTRSDPYHVAMARVRAGDPRAAMALLMGEASQERSARARFLRRAQAAEVMVGAGMEAVAMPILLELAALVESHRLEEWEEGDTVAGPLALLFRCAQQLGRTDVDTDALYERICRLDPVRAIQLRAGAESDEGS